MASVTWLLCVLAALGLQRAGAVVTVGFAGYGGDWGDWLDCGANQYVCQMQARYEDAGAIEDETALNGEQSKKKFNEKGTNKGSPAKATMYRAR